MIPEIELIISETIAEGISVPLADCNSYPAHKARISIHEMPDGEWKTVCDFLAAAIVIDLADKGYSVVKVLSYHNPL